MTPRNAAQCRMPGARKGALLPELQSWTYTPIAEEADEVIDTPNSTAPHPSGVER